MGMQRIQEGINLTRKDEANESIRMESPTYCIINC
jgi:hypothetical protein